MKPYVILNAAMTLDGKIATETGSSNISGKEDLIRVHELRKEVDAIMVGINTVIADDPRLTVHKIESKKEDNPIRVVVDGKGRIPIESRITNDDAPTIIAVSDDYKSDLTASDKYHVLKNNGVDFFFAGENQVDLVKLMNYLYEKGVRTLMLEGGSTLNFSMIKDGLIDEIRICVAPMVVGGVNAISLFGGDGFMTMDESVKLELVDSFSCGKDLVLKYKVKY
ncbi:2,5-diamino-6-ribosylamino-4(3H)-pyrimidinone 5'-phosphate reductase [Methanobrevibacter woesei]|uniref:2,5-diamino-6-(ribosylamino)-4(3H)-pyrimidinone 5'-phosphate reductase n=1 Tax=Methanobrevibacter woesei TaxID=190976 RepID=A0A2U1S858_9EURY|nr:2,5-diamino-6-(ribosylamino)-4(3H)-pyrimidinone 5'-phosphate reductase [Methanobrevibacter woesei]PWB86303.1 2,5-diamino-6-ribosylamino-4(3H)-pyrimidinone 5'-phosphate reductase [Methanobrevibacter woesei]